MKLRRGKPESISEVIEKVFKRLEKEKMGATAHLAWRGAAGKELAAHSRPIGVKKDTLIVAIKDSAWFYQANLKKEQILALLRKRKGFENITKISFRIGKT